MLVGGDLDGGSCNRGRRCGARNAASAMQAVEQGFEVDLAVVAGDTEDGGRCEGGCGREVQRIQHALRWRRAGFAGGDCIQHVGEQVDRLLRCVERHRVQRATVAAGRVEAILHCVAKGHHFGKTEEAGAALDRVEAAEHRVEAASIIRIALQSDHLPAQLVDDLARLDQEVRTDVRSGPAHGYNPSEDSSWLASSWVVGAGSTAASEPDRCKGRAWSCALSRPACTQRTMSTTRRIT